MKEYYWKFRKIFNQLIVLILIGYAIIWVCKNISTLNSILPGIWVKILIFFCLIFYIILVISTLKTIRSSNVLRAYDPTDPQSLKRLKSQKKYQLKTQSTLPGTIVQDLEKWLLENGYKKVALHSLGILYEKETPFLTFRFKRKVHRTFLLYRPLLNILIVDNILSEVTAFIHQYESLKPVSQNDLILISDMENEEEILSAGTGIVNYICSGGSGNLYPVFLDMNHQHIFYPQDISLLPWYKIISRKIYLQRLNNLFSQKTKAD